MGKKKQSDEGYVDVVSGDTGSIKALVEIRALKVKLKAQDKRITEFEGVYEGVDIPMLREAIKIVKLKIQNRKCIVRERNYEVG